MLKKVKYILLPYVLSFSLLCCYATATEVDKNIPNYQKKAGLSGNLNSVGSDTLNNLMTFWAEGFRKIYPSIQTQIEGKGSSTAPPALIEGTAQIGPMSRVMKKSEIEKFEKKYSFKPTRLIVALDALVVIVNKDNPLTSLNLPQLDAIFSVTVKGGYNETITKWDQLGLGNSWKNRFISLYGRNSASGTYGYFKETALFKGDFKKTVKEQPGSASVVQSIGVDRYSIGYTGIGFLTSNVKPLNLSKKKNGKAYSPLQYNNVINGKYPLSRGLNIYIAKNPNQKLDFLIKEFLLYIFSKDGQEVAIKNGYLPLTYGLYKKYIKILN